MAASGRDGTRCARNEPGSCPSVADLQESATAFKFTPRADCEGEAFETGYRT
jgi:hypothetical protein